ncbi:MAG TPA: zf-HC2 domain-containing protein [Terriglobales bacterium]|nr:zf-HC2 domain-containing protein [Terriglobales bacterium]
MAGELQHGMQCTEFDALLTDALDGVLGGPNLVRFNLHKSGCPACAAMFAEAQEGMNFLKALPELDPPAGFAERVLLATSGFQAKAKAETPRSWAERMREFVAPKFHATWTTVMQPRFAMSFGMAFFSISLVLNVIGVKVTNIKAADLRPSAIIRNYYETTGRLVKYYENIRFVYEMETRVRAVMKATTNSQEKQTDQDKDRKKTKQDNEPEQQNYRNYSFDDSRNVLAKCHECDLADYWWVSSRSEL